MKRIVAHRCRSEPRGVTRFAAPGPVTKVRIPDKGEAAVRRRLGCEQQLDSRASEIDHARCAKRPIRVSGPGRCRKDLFGQALSVLSCLRVNRSSCGRAARAFVTAVKSAAARADAPGDGWFYGTCDECPQCASWL